MENFRYPLLIGLDIGELFDLQIDVKRRKVYYLQNSRPKKYIALHIDTEENQFLDALLRQNEDVFSQNETGIERITIDWSEFKNYSNFSLAFIIFEINNYLYLLFIVNYILLNISKTIKASEKLL
jgi:hypothetical protein